MNRADGCKLSQTTLDQLIADDFVTRLWQKDGSLWSSDSLVIEFISKFLGWLDAPTRTLEMVSELELFAQQVQQEGFTDVVVCGMGGSSLSSLVWKSCGFSQGGLNLHILDSTVPASVLALRDSLDLQKTLFLIASKSGSTIEPLAFEEYFWDQLNDIPARSNNFVAITDPGSQLATRASERGYRKVFLGEPEIGGRFSAFSVFGMLPACLAGLNIESMLQAAIAAYPTAGNQRGLELGAWMGSIALTGVDKVTVATNGLDSVGLWAEQLVAESTGKDQKGILTIAQEPWGEPEIYHDDRAFLFFGSQRFSADSSKEYMDYPNFNLEVNSAESLASALYDLEIATAVAGMLLGLNPFDQPNVESAKKIAKSRLQAIQESGKIEWGYPTATEGDIKVFGGDGNGLEEIIQNFLGGLGRGDHFGLMAFIAESPAIDQFARVVRQVIRDTWKVATSFGYGPRYLHSTGQFHKGGPAEQRFLILTSDDVNDADIPGFSASFGQVACSQALGDIGALRASQKPVLHVHLGSDVTSGLARLGELLLKTQ